MAPETFMDLADFGGWQRFEGQDETLDLLPKIRSKSPMDAPRMNIEVHDDLGVVTHIDGLHRMTASAMLGIEEVPVRLSFSAIEKGMTIPIYPPDHPILIIERGRLKRVREGARYPVGRRLVPGQPLRGALVGL